MNKTPSKSYLPLMIFGVLGFGGVALFYLRFSPKHSVSGEKFRMVAPELNSELDVDREERQQRREAFKREYLLRLKSKLQKREQEVELKIKYFAKEEFSEDGIDPQINRSDILDVLHEELGSIRESLKQIQAGTLRVPPG